MNIFFTAERCVDSCNIELPIELKNGQHPIKYHTIKEYSLLQNGAVSDDQVMQYAFISSSEDARLGQWETALESAEGDDVRWFKGKINELQHQAYLVNQLLQIAPSVDSSKVRQWCAGDPLSLTLSQRWMIYASWKRKAMTLIEETIRVIEIKYRRIVKQLEEIRAKESAEICSSLDVVGITTTGAAKQRGFLDHLQCKIGTTSTFSYL